MRWLARALVVMLPMVLTVGAARNTESAEAAAASTPAAAAPSLTAADATAIENAPKSAAPAPPSATAALPPRGGSHLAVDDNTCATCHGEADLWGNDKRRLFIAHESLANDVHWQKGVNCHDCHGGDPTSFDVPEAHSTQVEEGSGVLPFRSPLDTVWQACGACHKEQVLKVHTGAHASAGPKNASGATTAISCAACHGGKGHGILPVADSRSPVSSANRDQTCGECHEKQLLALGKGVHASAGPKNASGAATVLGCAKCHGDDAHGILPVGDRRSPVFVDNQAGTCGACHKEQVLEFGKGAHAHAGPKDASGAGTSLGCTQCHGGDTHDMLPVSDRRSPVFADNWDQTCGACHKEQLRALGKGAHAGSKDASGSATPLSCAKCHGSNAHGMLPVGDRRSPVFLANWDRTCGVCHKEQMLELRKGVHAHAGPKDATGDSAALNCGKCHGNNAHDMLPVHDSRSPVFLDHQVTTCGDCHEKHLATYRASVHGKGLYQSGLTVVAVCADCHGDHGIYYAADRRSTLHSSNVAQTCGKCHRFVEERLQQSVHGHAYVRAKVTDKGPKAAQQKWRRPASCTDCHRGHQLLDPRLTPFRLQLANRCGNCHPDRSSRYGMSLHGQLTHLGYGPAAECADCHGAHDILPISDPKSRLAAGMNRLATCRQCHPNAVPNFADFDPHANCEDAASYPLLHNVTHSLRLLFFGFFAFFAIHSFLWFVRSFIHALQRGRHETLAAGEFVIIRSTPFDRILYATLLVCFLGLILTALPLKFSDQPWAEALARNLGGFRSTSTWHHFFAAVAIVACGTHLVRGVRGIVIRRSQGIAWRTILWGPDSRIPNFRDLKDLFRMVRWFFGLGPQPGFERWTYWEKFDYWAVYLTAAVIGGSGLMLWYPNLFCLILPGRALNVAKEVHSQVAVLAASFLFLFHFYNTHFRPDKFPVDLSALTGMVSETHLRKYRPEYVERLEREGKLDALRRPAPSRRRLWFVFLAGAMVLALGVALLLLVLVATLEK